jgi:hypothetical protein
MAPPSDNYVSGAARQIDHWYERFKQVQGSQPVPLLITHGAPDEGADQPKQTDPSTPTIDIIA